MHYNQENQHHEEQADSQLRALVQHPSTEVWNFCVDKYKDRK